MTTYSERLLDELMAVGLNPRGFTNGEPVGDWSESSELVATVLAVHVPGETDYLAADLESQATQLRALLGSGSPEWSAYLKVQTDLIRKLRRQEYVGQAGVNEVFMEMVSDGHTYSDSLDAAATAKEAVKQQYPWPGTYR